MNFVRPSLVQILSAVTALVTQVLNAARWSAGTRASMQFTKSVRPDELSRLVAPTFDTQVFTWFFALATAEDTAVDVATDETALLALLLQPAAANVSGAAMTAVATIAAAWCFAGMTDPPV